VSTAALINQTYDTEACESFLLRVLPRNGNYITGELTAQKKFKNRHASSVRNAVAQIFEIDEAGNDAFFALASYREPGTRKGSNVLSVKSFWIDIDCGEDKALDGKGYQTKAAALKELKAFCLAYGLPIPTIVDSGGGLHCYWILNQDIAAAEWYPLANKLKQIMALGAAVLLADPSRTADIASVLRPPETHNRKSKYNDATVRLLRESADINFVDFEAKVSAAHAKLPPLLQQNGDLSDGLGKYPPPPETPEEIERVKSMLSKISADCGYAKWRDIGWALASLDWTCGFSLFDDWSKTAHDRYDKSAATNVWDSYRKGGIGFGTLVHSAADAGWVSTTKNAEIEGALRGANGDIVNGRIFARSFRNELKFVHETKEWLKYGVDSGWVLAPPGEEIRAAKAVVDELRKHAAEKWRRAPDDTQTKRLMAHVERSSTEQKIHAMINLAKSEPGMTVQLSEVDANPMLLGVENGVINLRTQELIPTTPEILVTKRCSVSFDPYATTTHLDAFIKRITRGNPELAAFFQRLAGYILTGNVSEHCFFFFYGLGRNGKTTLAELLFWLLGDYAVILPTSTLMQSKRDPGAASPDLMLLKGRRLALSTETDENARFAEASLKAMTGGDTMTARNPYGLFASWTPTHKLLIVGNHRPVISGGDYGIWRRVKLIPFGETIADEECDGRLPEKLRSEGSGVLNWALDGLRDWQRQGLNPPKEVLEAGKAYQADMDIFGQWMDDHVEIAPSEKTATSDLYKAYTNWAKASGWLRPITRQAFGRRLTERGVFLEKAGNGTKFGRGVRLNAEGRAACF
jgi:putative DNA primase/helicase